MSIQTDRLTAMGFTCNPDGSLTRAAEPPVTPPSSNSKDVLLNPTTNTSLRLFLPRTAAGDTKLPVIIYAHGGGFIILRAVSTVCHNFCSSLANQTSALIVSVNYRLAPEHRLPAAYDDYMEALHWVKSTTDDWLTKYADVSNCYLMGSSAGGNIAFHAGLRAPTCAEKLRPVQIKGLILHQPFFGGVERTKSEIKSGSNMVLPLGLSDVMWEVALPLGADRDHEYSNPMRAEVVKRMDMVRDEEWKVLVTGCDGDTLYERQMEVVKALREKGALVVSEFVEGESHGYDIVEPSKAGLLFAAVKELVSPKSAN